MHVPSLTLNDGVTIPQFGLGVWQLEPEEARDQVARALELGYRHIDTAAIYGNEESVGEAIAASGIAREELFVTTKLWNSRHTSAAEAVRESLGKLGLDYVDLYLIHWPVPSNNQYVRAWQGLEAIKAEGLARSIGVSNFHADHLQALVDQGASLPSVNQIEVHPSFPQFELVEVNDGLGITTESWSPLGRGDLELPAVVELADQVGRTPAQVVLRWHIQRGLIVFPRSSNPERLRENADIFDFELDEQAMATLNGLGAGNRVGPDPDTFSRA